MSDSLVQLQIEQQIAHVRLNRPDKHNALNMSMFQAIDNTIRQLKRRRDVRVVIVSGAGESFCSGLDVKSVLSNKKDPLKLLWKWWPGQANLAQRVSVGWRQLKVPVIMVLHGKCWGGGMQIALGADYRIVSEDCSLAIMEARWGLIPDMGGTLGLQQCMSMDQAMKLAMTAEPVSAQQAKAIGLVTQVTDEPLQIAQELAEQLKQRSPDSNYQIKKLYQSVWTPKSAKVLAGETISQWKILLGKNQKIAVKRAMGNRDIPYQN